MPPRQSLSYIITLYQDDLQQSWRKVHEDLWNTGLCKYLGSQLEQCPTTGRYHWQAFVKFISKRSKLQCIELIERACWSAVTVERAEAINYGIKDDTRADGPIENGDKPKASDRHSVGGQRTKEQWDLIKKCVVNNDRDAIPTDIVLKYNVESRFNKLVKFWTPESRNQVLPPWLPNPWGLLLPSYKKSKKRHFWIYSREPNKGKTTLFAEPLAAEYCAYIKSGCFTYWNVTGNEQIIILDDYNFAGLRYDGLNQLCDGTYEYRVFMGGLLKLDTKPIIIVLSNQSIQDIYPYMHNLLYARFNEYELK